MRFDPLKHHRRSTRLPNFDYSSPDAYFVTICVHRGVEALGVLVDDGQMRLRLCGQVAVAQ